MPSRRSSIAALAALTLAGCPRPKPAAAPQPKSAADSAAAAAMVARPLAALAGQRIVVLPVLYVRTDSLGWGAQLGGTREYLAKLTDEITFAFGERGLKGRWVFPDELARTARRNAGYAQDPYALAADVLRPPITRQRREQIPDPLASQLRALVALSDARYALLPVEVRFERTAAGTGRAVLHVVLIDARASTVTMEVDVLSDPAAAPLPALPTSLAQHLADMVAAP